MATNANDLRAAAEYAANPEIVKMSYGHGPRYDALRDPKRYYESISAIARHILATVPADDRPHCPYTLVPMPVNADGRGPEMDPAKVVRTDWEVWDELNRCVAVIRETEGANDGK